MSLLRYICLLLISITLAASSALGAQGAPELGIETGSSALPDASSPLLGAEYTVPMSKSWELGGFYDHNFLPARAHGFGALHFFGLLGRLQLEFLPGLFLDGKLGAAQTVENGFKFLAEGDNRNPLRTIGGTQSAPGPANGAGADRRYEPDIFCKILMSDCLLSVHRLRHMRHLRRLLPPDLQQAATKYGKHDHRREITVGDHREVLAEVQRRAEIFFDR